MLNSEKVRFSCFFFNDTATTEIYTLSLHDALPISTVRDAAKQVSERGGLDAEVIVDADVPADTRITLRTRNVRRSEEHTSELQSRQYLVCRLLLEKKKIILHKSNIFPRSYNIYLFT